jgi:hypothetical protein
VSVRAVPNSGYSFYRWTGSMTGSTNPLTITMSAPMNVTANFFNGTIGPGTVFFPVIRKR